MNKVYFPNLNGLRFFAALSVMIYHFFGENTLNGHFGVVLFFVLSGFLITYLLLEEKENKGKISISKFYLRRILRIWPIYFFILILAIVIVNYTTGLNSTQIEAIPYYLFFVPNWAFVVGATIKYAGILWSVGAEEQFYLTWPWVIQKVNKKKLVYVFSLIAVIWAIFPHLLDYMNNNYFSNIESVRLVSKFMGRTGFGAMATGAIIAYLAKYYKNSLNYIFSRTFQTFVFIGTLIIWGGDFFPHIAIVDGFYSILFAILIANFGLNPDVIFSLENRVFNYLGKISFGLYVYHLIAFGAVNKIMQIMLIDLPNEVSFVVGLLITIGFSSLSYHLLEKRFLKIKARRYTVINSGSG
tara:strand:- start:5115 stop:6179 length:1065 start_codon:yes stop_codon:yes gene_type:complete